MLNGSVLLLMTSCFEPAATPEPVEAGTVVGGTEVGGAPAGLAGCVGATVGAAGPHAARSTRLVAPSAARRNRRRETGCGSSAKAVMRVDPLCSRLDYSTIGRRQRRFGRPRRRAARARVRRGRCVGRRRRQSGRRVL